MSEEIRSAGSVFYVERDHLQFENSSASSTSYWINDAKGAVLSRGILTLWPLWDDALATVSVRGVFLEMNKSGDVSHLMGYKLQKTPKEWDSDAESKRLIEARARWHIWVHEGGYKQDNDGNTQAAQEPAQDPT